MILGKPNNIEDYICVDSEDAIITLHKFGFIPIYRDIKTNNTYFIKTKGLDDFMFSNNIINNYGKKDK